MLAKPFGINKAAKTLSNKSRSFKAYSSGEEVEVEPFALMEEIKDLKKKNKASAAAFQNAKANFLAYQDEATA